MLDTVLSDILDEIERAEATHGTFQNIQQAAAVAYRESQEAWSEVWNKPYSRTALYMEHKHAAASHMRAMLLLRDDKAWPTPGPFASRGDDMVSASMPEVK